jgi:hypothetical protein
MIAMHPIAVAALLCAAGSSFPAAWAGSKAYRIDGARQDEEGKWRPMETLEVTHRSVTFQVRHVDPAACRAAIASLLGRDVPLVRPRSEEGPGHMAFIVQIDNASEEPVHFNPMQAWLMTDKGDAKIALDYSELYVLGRSAGPAAPTTDEVAAVFFDRTVTIQPGGSVRKILLFDAPREDRFRTFDIKIADVTIGTIGEVFVFPFRKFPEKT